MLEKPRSFKWRYFPAEAQNEPEKAQNGIKITCFERLQLKSYRNYNQIFSSYLVKYSAKTNG